MKLFRKVSPAFYKRRGLFPLEHSRRFFQPIAAVLVAAVSSALAFALASAPGTCQGFDARDSIKRAVAAHGGTEAIQMIEETGVRKGSFTQFLPVPNSGSFVEWRKGDKLRLEVQVAGLEVVQGYDGHRAWVQSFGQVIDAPEQIQTAIESEQRHNLLLLVHAQSEDYQVVEAEASALLDSSLVQGVTVIPPDDLPSTSFYFDSETWKVVKMSYTDANPFVGGDAKFEVYFLDYTAAGEIPYPSKVIHYIDGLQLDEVLYESLDFDAAIADEAFLKPGVDRDEGLGETQVTVPLDYVLNMVFTEARINDAKEPSSFILDTGAGITCLSYEAAAQHGIVPQADFGAAGAGGAVEAKTAHVESLTIGGLTIKDLEVMLIDISSIGAMMDRRIDGILGYNILNRFATTIDIAGGSLTLADCKAPLPEGEGFHTISFQVFMGVPLIEGVIDSTAELDFLVDTGAALSVLPQTVAAELEPKGTIAGAMAAGADARPMEMAVARFTELALDGVRIPEPLLSYPVEPSKADPVGASIDTANRGVLGTTILRNFRMTLNYDRAILVLEPVEFAPGEDFEWCGPGLAIFREEGDVVVRSVYGGSPADGVIERGDKIMEIDGTRTEELNVQQVVDLLRGKPGTSLKLVIERGGEKKTVNLKRERLL